MPYTKSPRPYKREYKKQVERGEHPARMKRQKARRLYDAEGIDREGKDIDHVIPLSKGGSNSKSNLRLSKPSTNRSKKNK